MILLTALFYVLWFACVYASKHDLGLWVYSFSLLAAWGLHKEFKLYPISWWKLLFLALTGVTFDSLALKFGWIVLAAGATQFAPHWLIALWIVFALALPLYLPWFQNRLWMTSILGAVTGPLSYAGGKKLDVLSFGNNTAIFYYALFWGAYFPLSLWWIRPRQDLAPTTKSLAPTESPAELPS